MPAIKSQPDEVVAYLTETKEALANKIVEGQTAISNRISESKETLTDQVTAGKEVIYSKISAGTEAIAKSRPGIAISEGKQAIVCRLVQGKESLGNTVASGRDAVYTKIQAGTEHLANTRAGALVGSGVDRTLSTTEGWVEYLLPEIENEKELMSGCEKEMGLPLTRSANDDDPAQEDEEALPVPSRAERVCTLSQKVKLRMYFHSVRKLQVMQQNCKCTLEQLKQAVDLVSSVLVVCMCVSWLAPLGVFCPCALVRSLTHSACCHVISDQPH